MTYSEVAVLFGCADDTLLGILSKPETPSGAGVIVIVGGPQYRVGSHRQFVLLSRALATAGHPVLRFDYRGMGDSDGERRDFQAVSADISAAIDVLYTQKASVKKVVLWGLCDAASAALLYCQETNDPRVSGLCLLNPWVRSELSLARTQVKHYYLQRLAQKEFWGKLLSGKVAWGALGELAGNVMTTLSGPGSTVATKKLPFQTRMAQAWKKFNRPILLLLSGDDYTAKEFQEYAQSSSDWSGALSQPLLQRCDLPEADHTCSSAAWRGLVEVQMLEWLMRSGLSSSTPNGTTRHGGT